MMTFDTLRKVHLDSINSMCVKLENELKSDIVFYSGQINPSFIRYFRITVNTGIVSFIHKLRHPCDTL